MRDTLEKEPEHFWQPPGSSGQSWTLTAPAPASASSSCCRKLQRWPRPCYSSLSFSQQEVLKGMEGALAVHGSPSLSQQEMVCGVREAHTKTKKKVYIFINAKINI